MGKSVNSNNNSKEINQVYQWLSSSIKANNGNGSAAYFSLFSGWSKAYPETTGYLFPTLQILYNRTKDEQILKQINSSILWILSLQKADGSFPQGITSNESIVFDNGQILLGLTSCLDSHPEILPNANRLNQWLYAQMNISGQYIHNTYTKGYSPSYHSRCLWAQLNFEVATNELTEAKRNSFSNYLDYYLSLQNDNGSFKNWGFSKTENFALSHTIIYTLRGIYETALILKNKDAIDRVSKSVDQILKNTPSSGIIPGRYNQDWLGRQTFTCNAGNAQLAILLFKLSTYYNKPDYFSSGEKILNQLKNKIIGNPLPGIKNGVFSSSPFYKEYQAFKMTNWTMKFILDALLIEESYGSQQD